MVRSWAKVWLKLLFLLSIFGFVGCRETPQAVYERAVLAQQEKDFEVYLSCFDKPSRKILVEVVRLDKDTRGRLRFLRDPYDLGIWGDFETEVVHDDYAVVTAHVDKASQAVIFHLEEGQWRVSLFNVARFWRLPQ